MTLEAAGVTLSDARGIVSQLAIDTASSPPWIAALAAVRTALADMGGKGTVLDMTISESYTHLALLHARSAALEADEIETIARHHFRPMLGETAGQYEYRMVALAQPESAPALLCCAIDAHALRDMQQAASEAGIAIASLCPRIVAFETAHADELSRFTGHLVLADTQTTLFITVRSGEWLQVASRRIDTTPDWLATTLDQNDRLTAPGARSVWLAGSLAKAELTGWQIKRTTDFPVRMPA